MSFICGVTLDLLFCRVFERDYGILMNGAFVFMVYSMDCGFIC